MSKQALISFQYREERGGHFMPYLPVKLSLGGVVVFENHSFLVDTGASITIVPWAHAGGFTDRLGKPQTTPCIDGHGKPILSSPLNMLLQIKGLEPFEETVHFCQGWKHSVLGQSSFFQKVEGLFCNCTTDARWFGLRNKDMSAPKGGKAKARAA